MKRPPQHVIDDLGVSQVRGIFEPLGWTVDLVDHDYGVDLVVEVFRESKTTGATFKIQLKSSRSTAYSADGSFVSQELGLPQARYLAQELRSPVLLMHADVSIGRTFWYAPQLDRDLVPRLSTGSDLGSLTVRIPTAAEIPSGLKEMLRILSQVETVLASRVIAGAAVPEFAEAIRRGGDRVEVIREFQAKAVVLQLDEANRLLRAGDHDGASRYVESVKGDPNAAVEAKFTAVLIQDTIEQRALYEREGGDEAQHVAALDRAKELQDLARKGPTHLKLYALIVRKAAELELLVYKDWSLFMNVRALQRYEWDLVAAFQLASMRAAVWRAIAAKYRQCVRLLNYAAGSKSRWALASAVCRVTYPLMTLIIRFQYEQWPAAAQRLRKAAFEITKLAATFAAEVGDQQGLGMAASTAAMLATEDSSEENQWALGTAQSLSDLEDREGALELIEKASRRRRGEHLPGTKSATPRQIFENMASARGIDLADPIAIQSLLC